MTEKFESSSSPELLTLADSLEELQGKENQGRGVQCVRSIITFLRIGDLRSARTVAWTDYDKIRNYPAIQEKVDEYLLKDWSPAQEEE